MLFRRAALVATALLLAGLTGCAGAPEATPTPTPTGFASEEEAFAAAEETYRAYNHAVNAYNAGDTAVDPLDFLAGGVRTTDADIRRQAEDAGLRFQGETRIKDLEHLKAATSAGLTEVVLNVCIDDTDLKLINADGKDVTLPDAPKVYMLDITLSGRDEKTMKIVESELVSSEC